MIQKGTRVRFTYETYPYNNRGMPIPTPNPDYGRVGVVVRALGDPTEGTGEPATCISVLFDGDVYPRALDEDAVTPEPDETPASTTE